MPNDKLFLLLGAGASLPGMLTTAEVTTRLLQWDFFREPQPATTGLPATSQLLSLPSGSDARAPLYEALRAIIATGLRDPSILNFEHLMHAIEQMASIFALPAISKSDRYRFLPAPLLSVAPSHANWNIEGANYWAAASETAYAILSWFKERCDTVSTPHHPQAAGLSALAAEGNDLRIFSLNYDDLPFQTGLNFYTGFGTTGHFEPAYPWPSLGHSLCQLHGSVLFGSAGSDIMSFPDRDAAAKARQTRHGSAAGIFQDGHHAAEAPLIAGLRKADKTLVRPFGTYMHVLREELLRTPRWLIVGYGFGDVHINQAMQQARNNWRLRGTEVRIAIVDWHDPLRDNNGDPILDAWHGTPAAEVLERLCTPVFADDLMTFMTPVIHKLSPNLFAELSPHLAIDLTGVAGALGPHRALVTEFLNRK